MPTYLITAPDGRKFQVSGPGSQQEALAQVQAQYQQSAPVAQQPPPSAPEPPRSGLQHAADVADVFSRHPMTAGIGMAENMLSSVTGGAGSLADAVTFSDPGSHDWSYRPRTQAGQQIEQLGGVEAERAGQKYDKYLGTGPLATTVKERGQEALGAVGTVTALAGVRGLSGGRVPRNVGPHPNPSVRAAVPGEAPVPEGAPQVQRPAGLASVSEAPSKETLKKDAKAAYKRAEDAGVVITPESFSTAQQSIRSMLEKEGIDPTLHPATTAALKRISEEKGPITLEKLETLRKIAKSAESTLNKSDQRLAAKIVDTLDGYADTLGAKDVSAGNPAAASALREARNFYSRARKADELDELMSRAELSAPNFSASGMENAIRTEFRNLAKNQRRMRLFTKEEQAAIRKVAMGGPIENSLRMLGKMAPTGAVSGLFGIGATMAAGPAGAALPVAGIAARYGAAKMTIRNANRANELVRRGPTPKPRNRSATEKETAQTP